jgi:hypothetical protein
MSVDSPLARGGLANCVAVLTELHACNHYSPMLSRFDQVEK